MEKGLARLLALFAGMAAHALATGCSGGGVFSQAQSGSGYSGYVIVTSPTSNTVSLFDPAGNYVRTLRDLNSPSQENPGAIVPSPAEADEVWIAVYGSSRIERVSLADSSYTTQLLHSNIVYPQGLALDLSGNLLIGDFGYYTLEKYSSAGYRLGSPFVSTTTTTCVIANPYSIAVAADGTIAVGNSAAHSVQLYNSDGSCLLNLNTAPFNANSPRAVAYDSVHDKFIVAFNTNGAIYAVSTDGASSSQIFLDTTVIANPTSVAADSSGNLYVASTSQDTIEKLVFDGTTATRVGEVPFIPASRHTLDPTYVMVVP